MSTRLSSILGPRVPRGDRTSPRYLVPLALLIVAAGLLVGSFWLPYWRMTLHAPQYPAGLHVQAYLNRLEGDVREIDGLNHYIGMRPLEEAARLERATSIMAVAALALLLLSGVIIHNRRAALVALPAMLFPAAFLADLWYWLHTFGHGLDPHAALSNSIKPFSPPVLGTGVIGQFKTVASAGEGWWMSLAASIVIIAALWFHRRAFKPLVDAQRRLSRADRRRGRAAREPVTSGAGSMAAGIVTATLLASAAHAGAFDLQSAIAAAPPGSTLTVPPGVHEGSFVIDRPLVLVAGGDVSLDGGGAGDIIRITAPDVTVRGFTLRCSGARLDLEHAGIIALAPRVTIERNVIENVLFGIVLKGAPGSVVRGNTIRGMPLDIARRGDGIRLWHSGESILEDNHVAESRDVVMWFSNGLLIRRNSVRNSRYGMHFMYTDDNVLEENQLEDNSVGAFLMYSRAISLKRNVFARNRGPSGYGLGLKDMDGIIAEDNLFVGNRVGAYIDNSPQVLTVYDEFRRNAFVCNDIGLAFLPSVKRNRFAANAFIENLQQVAVIGTGNFSGNDFTVAGEGNYWSDYRGFDLRGDGIGDLPYRADSAFDDLMQREPKLRLFLHSPAQQAIDLAARAFPVVRPVPRVRDEAPLMAMPASSLILPPRPAGTAMAAVSVALVLVAASTMLLLRSAAAGAIGGRS